MISIAGGATLSHNYLQLFGFLLFYRFFLRFRLCHSLFFLFFLRNDCSFSFLLVMAKDLDNLCSKLSLENKDGDSNDEVFLDVKGTKEIHAVGDSCLATKMLLRKPFNVDAMKASFMKVWQIKDGLEIKEVYDSTFLFYFDDLMLRANV